MGYMTTVLILNDGFDQLKKHPEQFVEGISQKMHDGGDVSVGYHANAVHVMRSEHADVPRLYLTWRNTIMEMSPTRQTMEVAGQFPVVVQNFVDVAREQLDHLQRELDTRKGNAPKSNNL